MRTHPPWRADRGRDQTVPERPRGGFFSHRGLLMVASVTAMADAAVALAAAPGARALAPQVTALAPLAVFHDLRWLYVYNGSWAGFGALLIGLLVTRTVVDAVLVRLAWPRGVGPPRLLGLFRSAAGAAVFTGLVLSPLVTLAFGVALLPFSWPLLATLPVLLLMAALLSHAGVVPWWCRALPPVRAAGWAVADFAALSLAAAVAGSLPGPWAVPVAGVAGLFNARAWYGVTTALATPQPARRYLRRPARRLPLAPLAVVVAVALVIGVARLAFSAATSPGAARVTAAAQQVAVVATQATEPAGPTGPGRPGSPVLEIQGFGSSCCAAPGRLSALSSGGIVQQFSYRGVGASGRPLAAGPAASDLPLPQLGDRIAAQVWRLYRQTGHRVDVVAESEGTLGVDAMLARHPGVPLGSVVLLSPIIDPGQATYPSAGAGGPGLVPGGELRAVISFIGGLSPYGASGAQTLISSVNSTGARFAAAAVTFARHHHTVRWLAAVPLADALTLPACALPSSAVVVAALHGGLAGHRDVQRMVRDFFAGRAIRGGSGLQEAAGIVAAAATAWRMPAPALPSPPCPAP